MGIEDLKSIDALMATLKIEGSAHISQEIQEAMNRACTGTEFYSGVGFVLGKVAKSQASEMTKARALKLRSEIAELIDCTFNEPED